MTNKKTIGLTKKRWFGYMCGDWGGWDAVNDPLMGAIMDKAFARKQDPRGKFRPWLQGQKE